MQKDSVARVLLVAITLCVVCSVLVSAVAVGLKERQDINSKADKKRSVLVAAGVAKPGEKVDIDKEFESIETFVVALETGNVDAETKPDDYNPRKKVKEAGEFISVDPKLDAGAVKAAAKKQIVYVRRTADGQLDSVILEVYGLGLWSTLRGFMALEKDLNTVRGLVFYDHKETPGLGGEVDNPTWRGQWEGKTLFNDEGEYVFDILKGKVPDTDPMMTHRADGISGATITCNGVDGMLRFWMSDAGYGKFLKQLAAKEKSND